ncbi:hypothetical protein HYX10_00970 [Candidatus Woesearchaeota archaeon]|nr:hypothetical protein [Candidatus Woesearchaeota archaeon]
MDEKNNPAGSTDVSQSFEGSGDKLPENIRAAEEKNYRKTDFRPKHLRQEQRNFFLKHYDENYRKLLIIPAAVVLLAVAVLLFSYSTTGEFFQKDVSIRGGVTVTILKTYDNLRQFDDISESLGTTVNARKLTAAGADRGIILDAGVQSDEDVGRFLQLIQEKTGPLADNEFSVQTIGSSLGANFFKSIMISMAAAFALMAAVVFVYFRFAAGRWILIPSGFVVWTVFVDILCTFAVISLLQVKVSTAGLAAFMLLLGYSVDTDILLTMRVLKGRQEKIFDRIVNAAKTGIFLTVTAMIAVTAGLLLTQAETIRQIMLILVIGLAFDLLHTWLTNAGVLRWYMERGMYEK